MIGSGPEYNIVGEENLCKGNIGEGNSDLGKGKPYW